MSRKAYVRTIASATALIILLTNLTVIAATEQAKYERLSTTGWFGSP